MHLNETPSGERIHIGFFGVRNAGKSSLVNAVTNQEVAIVSDLAGTTTDPVRKTMELLPIGPVLIIDTPGIDDEGKLGAQRVLKTHRELDAVDIAVLVVDGTRGTTQADHGLVRVFQEKRVPYIVVFTKLDKLGNAKERTETTLDEDETGVRRGTISVSAASGQGINELKELIGRLASQGEEKRSIISDLISTGDTVVLVIPIDSSAPKGRIILPQQQVLRDVLDVGAMAYISRETELQSLLNSLILPPKMVVTDSQAFAEVARIVPESVPLTSFSILFARYKGELAIEVKGANMLDSLMDGDEILISEGCTHHRQCEDIGTVKLPKMIRAYSGVNPSFTFSSGGEFSEDLSAYKLVVHCGGCMLNAREMKWRIQHSLAEGVAFTNYGIAMAKMQGILERVTAPFKVA